MPAGVIKQFNEFSCSPIINKTFYKIINNTDAEGCRGGADKGTEFKLWWSVQQSVGLNPGLDTCVLEQDT